MNEISKLLIYNINVILISSQYSGCEIVEENQKLKINDFYY